VGGAKTASRLGKRVDGKELGDEEKFVWIEERSYQKKKTNL